jgi:hypothetical protein
MKRLNECSCGCGAAKGGCNDNDANYMFFGNLKTIKKYVDAMLQMDPRHVQSILSDGHDWAADHIATSKDDIQEVGDFLMNEMQHEDHMKCQALQEIPNNHNSFRLDSKINSNKQCMKQFAKSTEDMQYIHPKAESDWEHIKHVKLHLNNWQQ